MSDDRDPGRTDGSHPDEPRDRVPGGDAAPEKAIGSDAASADPVSPYGPAAAEGPAAEGPAAEEEAREPAAAPAPDPRPAPPAPPAGYDPAGHSGHGAAAGTAGPGHPPLAASPSYAAAGAPALGYAPPAGTPPYVSGEPPRPRGGRGVAIAALIVGIVAVIGAVIPFLNYVAFLPAFAAIVLGIVSLARRMDGKPLALTGLVLGVVAFVLSIVLAIVYTFAFVSAVSGAVESSDGTGVLPSAAPTSADGTDPSADGTDPSADGDMAGAPGTSPDDPLPIGTTVTGDGIDGPEWEVTLGTPTLDATAAVLAADPSNEAPADGMQYAVVPVTATYLGSSTGDPLSELAVGFLAADGSQHSAADSFVQAPAPAFTDDADLLEPQGTATGNVVVEIPIDGAEGGLWATAPGLIADAYYFRAG